MQAVATQEGGKPLFIDSMAIYYRRKSVCGFLAEMALPLELTKAILTALSVSP